MKYVHHTRLYFCFASKIFIKIKCINTGAGCEGELLHEIEIESADFNETFVSLKSREDNQYF
jgi:hypothetical protein